VFSELDRLKVIDVMAPPRATEESRVVPLDRTQAQAG
jgi:hypothetical protein